jgi:putative transcriptional regulator
MEEQHRPGPRPIDVLALRRRMQLTQKQFAGIFGFSVAALRHWERGERKPRGPALTLLNVISRSPRAVLIALRRPAKLPCPFCQPIE